MLRSILRSLRQSAGRYTLLAIPILLGSLSLTVLFSIYSVSRSAALRGISGLQANEIVATPRQGNVPFLLHPLEPRSISSEGIAAMRSIPGVASLQARRVLQSAVSVRLSILGQTLESDTPLYGIEGDGTSQDGQKFIAGQATIPVLLSRSFVSLMGTTLADTLSLPRLNADLLVGHDITILTGHSSFFPSDKAQVQQWPARIVGLSDRVPFVGLSIPMADLQAIADTTGSTTRISDVLLTLSPTADIGTVQKTLEGRGFTTDSISQRLGLVQDRLTTLLLVLACVGLLLATFTIVTVMAIVWSDIQLHTHQIGIMRSFGAATGHVLRFFLGKVAIVSGIAAASGALLGILLSAFGRSNLLSTIPTLPSVGTGTLIAILATSTIIVLIISLLAALPPILRATRLSPVRALGEEA